MAEPANANAKLAERLSSIALALAKPNGHDHVSDVFTDEVLHALGKPIVHFVKERVAEAVTPLNAHIAKLEARLAELEGRHVLEDAGTWQAGKSYRPGSVVQDHGSRWVCLTDTTSRPPGDDWQLWVKRGRDAK